MAHHGPKRNELDRRPMEMAVSRTECGKVVLSSARGEVQIIDTMEVSQVVYQGSVLHRYAL